MPAELCKTSRLLAVIRVPRSGQPPIVHKTQGWHDSCIANLAMKLAENVVARFSGKEAAMQQDNDKGKEKWMELCAQAANEQDPDKLMALIGQIAALLEAKQQGLTEKALGVHPSTEGE